MPELSVKNLIVLGVGIAFLLFIVAAIMPSAITNIAEANTTGWETSTITMWNLLEVFGVLAIVIGVVAIALKALGRI